MIDPKKITPLLSNMTVERELGRGSNGAVYLVNRHLDGKLLALKHISIPARQAQTRALIYAGAVSNETEAQRYYAGLVRELKTELLQLNGIQNAHNLLKFRGYQVDQKVVGQGYDVYLLSDYCRSLPELLAAQSLTKLQAVNLALDLCSALEQLRSQGLYHKDVRPNNIFQEDGRFLLGDLGLVKKEELAYSSMPEQLITEYTAPELVDQDASLDATMDIYSVGLILYEIYNGYVLPPCDSERFVRTPGELEAPAYADPAMAEIILKACNYDPAQRYQDPSEMKQALTLYMQRSTITEEPLLPEPEPEEADVPEAAEVPEMADAPALPAEAERPVEAVSPEEPQETDGTESAAEYAEEEATAEPEEEATETEAEETVSSDATRIFPAVGSETETPAEPDMSATKRYTLNDLSDDDLLVPTEGEISVEDFLASIRTTPGLEVLAMDERGQTTTMPGYETEETLPADTEFLESADARVHYPEAVAEELDYPEELPAEPLQAPVYQAPVYQEQPAYESGETYAPPVQQPVQQPVRQQRQQRYPQYTPEYDDGYEDEDEYDEYDDEYEDRPSRAWKKALIAVIVLLVLAGGAFAAYTFKTDTIEDMQAQVLSSSSVQITVDSLHDSPMEVSCSTAGGGEVARVPLTESGATFTGLNPGTDYSFTLHSTDGKLLLDYKASKTVSAKTAQMTTLTGFSATSISAVSADLVIRGTGDQPESWVITCTGNNGDVVTTSFSDASQPVRVEGLTPETNYTATIARSDGDQLSGTTTYNFTTQSYTILSSLEVTDVSTDSVTVAWNYSGTVPETWSLTCEGTDGSSTTQEIVGTECTLDGLTPGVIYSITVTCPSIRETELNTVSVGIPNVTVTEISAVENENGDIEVSWEFTGDTVPQEWSVSYTFAALNPETPSLATTTGNSVVLTGLLPNAEYTIVVESADNLKVGGATQTTCVTTQTARFTEFGCTDPEMTLFYLDEFGDEVETDSFTSDQEISFAIQVSYDETEEEKNVRTLYVIRNADGLPVYYYRNDSPGRSWPGNWTSARHSGNLTETPQIPGLYTLEVYFNDALLASAEFSISE